MFAQCLRAVGVRPADTRDQRGRERWLAFTPRSHLHMVRWGDAATNRGTAGDWYWKGKPDGQHGQGTAHALGCCAAQLVAMHGYKGKIGAEEMDELEYLLYGVRVALRRPMAHQGGHIKAQGDARKKPPGTRWTGYAVWDPVLAEYVNEN